MLNEFSACRLLTKHYSVAEIRDKWDEVTEKTLTSISWEENFCDFF